MIFVLGSYRLPFLTVAVANTRFRDMELSVCVTAVEVRVPVNDN